MLGLVEIPKHSCTVFAARGAERAVGGDGDGVDIAGMADVVGLNAAGSEFPDLEECGVSQAFNWLGMIDLME